MNARVIMQMRLVTLSGLLKYKTECAPSNGYFLMPLYDKVGTTFAVPIEMD